MLFHRFLCGVGLVLLAAGWLGLPWARGEVAVAAEGGYPLVPFPGIRLGMSEAELLAVDEGVAFASPESGDGGERVAVLKKDDVVMLFFVEGGRVAQVNYGWEGRSEKEQRERTRVLLEEFGKRYGEPFKAKESRVMNRKPVVIGVRKYPMGGSETAVVESNRGKVLVSIADTRRLAWMAQTGSAMASLMEEAAGTEELEGSPEKPGLFGFRPPKKKPEAKGAAEKKDFIAELDWKE